MRDAVENYDRHGGVIGLGGGILLYTYTVVKLDILNNLYNAGFRCVDAPLSVSRLSPIGKFVSGRATPLKHLVAQAIAVDDCCSGETWTLCSAPSDSSSTVEASRCLTIGLLPILLALCVIILYGSDAKVFR